MQGHAARSYRRRNPAYDNRGVTTDAQAMTGGTGTTSGTVWTLDPDDPDIALARQMVAHPDNLVPAIDYARSAERREDWHRAEERWRFVRTRFPADPIGYTEGLTCLMKTGPVEAVESLCAVASEVFPAIDRFGMEYAWQAHHRCDWDTALARWRRFREQFPDRMPTGEVATLVAAGRLLDAEALVETALAREPANLDMRVAHASQARERGDLAAANGRWRVVLDRFPDFPAGYRFAGWCLRDSGRLDDAEAVFESACLRFPDDAVVAVEYARCAMAKGAWQVATERWEHVRARFPSEPAGYIPRYRAQSPPPSDARAADTEAARAGLGAECLFLSGDSYPADKDVETELCARIPGLRAQRDWLGERAAPDLEARLSRASSILESNPNTVLIGRSSGARLATLLALRFKLRAVVCLGYPFQHPDAVIEPERFFHLGQIRIPTLILQGSEDEYGGAEITERYGLSASVEVRILQGIRHDLRLSSAGWDRVGRMVTAFLSDPSDYPMLTDFDEVDYLRRYPDVAAAVADGLVDSGRTHFVQRGRYENRRYRLRAIDVEAECAEAKGRTDAALRR